MLLTPYENDLLHEPDIRSLRDTSEVGPPMEKNKRHQVSFNVQCCMLLFVISTIEIILSFSSSLIHNKKHQCNLRLMTLMKDY